MKKLLAIILTLTLIFALSGCGSNNATSSVPDVSSEPVYSAVDMSVACMTGPTGIGMAKLMADAEAPAINIRVFCLRHTKPRSE